MPLKLGSDFKNKIIFIKISFLFFLQFKIGYPKNIKKQIRIKFLDKKFNLTLNNRIDLEIIKDIFLDEEYKTKIENPKIIFDLGSNIGISVLYFKAQYPQAKIYAVEANPVNFKYMQDNIRLLGNVEALNLAIAGQNKVGKFFIAKDNQHQSSSMIKRQVDQESIAINYKTLDSLLSDYSISKVDLIKFDIEGANMKYLKILKI